MQYLYLAFDVMSILLALLSLFSRFVIIYLIILIVMEAKKELKAGKNPFLRIYLLVISIVAIGGGAIALGFFIYPTLTKDLISDEEYGRNRRQYTQCSDDYYTKPIMVDRMADEDEEVTVTKKSEPEIADCQDKALAQISQDRSYQYKETVIISLTRFFIFAFLFVTHFPFFLKTNREEA